MGDYLNGSRRSKAAGQIPQDEHCAAANANKTVSGLLTAPASLGTADTTLAGGRVGKGNICRIRTTATTYIAFGASDIAAVTSSTATGLELFGAGVFLVVATEDYVRADIAFARIEIITG